MAPEGHKRLRAFNILLVSHDTKINRELAVKHNPDTAVNSFFVKNILPGAHYTVTITSVCVFEILKSESEPEMIKFSTLPEQPSNLSLETRQDPGNCYVSQLFTDHV